MLFVEDNTLHNPNKIHSHIKIEKKYLKYILVYCNSHIAHQIHQSTSAGDQRTDEGSDGVYLQWNKQQSTIVTFDTFNVLVW